MATIRDIAREADVAVSTASLALRDDERVKPQTRARVLEVAEKLDYRPSRTARSLSSGLSYTIQLLNPLGTELTSGFFTRFLRGLHDAARESFYTVAFSIVEGEEEAASHTDTLMRERWTDGIVLLNPSDNSALLELMSQHSFPYVVLGRDPLGRALSVDNDNMGVGRDAARYLIGRNRKRLRFISGAPAQTFAQDRAAGFSAAAGEAGVDGEVVYNDGTPETAALLARQALDQGCDAIVAASDPQAASAIAALKEAGARVPEDMAVLGMNNDVIAEYVEPRLTSVDLSAYRLGLEAAALLLERIGGTEIPDRKRLVPHRLVERAST